MLYCVSSGSTGKTKGPVRSPFPSLTANREAPFALLLHELVRQAELQQPAARVDVARVIARLEPVLAAGVGIGRILVEQVADAGRDARILVDQALVAREQVEDAVRTHARVGLPRKER